MKEPKTVELKLGPLPPSCLGPDGRFREETEEERRKRLESARRRLREIAEIPNTPMILWMRHGCERSMNSVRIGQFSREVTRAVDRLSLDE